MSYDTARRERARKYLDSVTEWPSGSSGGWTMSDVLDAYHAGAHEEAAIKDKEIERLHHALVLEAASYSAAEVEKLNAEITALTIQREADAEMMHSEIAALRKVVRSYYDSLRYEGASDACLMIGINESVVRRAIEEKP